MRRYVPLVRWLARTGCRCGLHFMGHSFQMDAYVCSCRKSMLPMEMVRK